MPNPTPGEFLELPEGAVHHNRATNPMQMTPSLEELADILNPATPLYEAWKAKGKEGLAAQYDEMYPEGKTPSLDPAKKAK